MKLQKSFKNEFPTLYIIPTPIGNLEDITIRILNTLKELDVLYCEDTRNTRKLLNRYEISVLTKPYHEFNKERAVSDITHDLENNKSVGLVSDAGMPGISDPGYDIIKECKNLDVNVVVLPGATAFLVALIRSNFPNNRFEYFGFLGINKKQKREKLEEIFTLNYASVFYESPHKLLSTLKLMAEIDGEKKITIARELTKINEEYLVGTVYELLEYFNVNAIKGEFVIVVDAAVAKKVEYNVSVEDHVGELVKLGYSKKEAIKEVAKQRKMKKNDVYKLFID